MRSPYTVLGVTQTASVDDIKSAYRQLAKTWHPDQKPDDPRAGVKFAEIAQAYKLLIDPDLRLKFDQGHIDARGMVVHIFGDAAAKKTREQALDKTGQRTKTDAPGMDEDPLTTLDNLFKKWKSRHKPKTVLPSTYHQIDITLETAFAGCEEELMFGDVEAVTYEVPAGTVDGGEIVVSSPNPQLYGDAVVTVRHQPHDRFRSSGSDLHGDHPIELAEAVLGGSFVYEGLDGPVRIDVPEWSGSDTVLEIKEKGLPKPKGKRGSLHVHLRVMLPEKPDPHLKDLMRSSKKAWYL
jgi:DnaJ-class molecular chaperone